MTDGEMSDSPLAAARTASTRSVGPESLRRNPVAPERSAPYTYSSVSNVVTTTMRGPVPFPPARSVRVASSPSSLGMRMSKRHTSGFSRRASDTATTPSGASATTSMSGWASMMARNPARTISWSSAISTRIATPRA